jgi:hypothetical protein
MEDWLGLPEKRTVLPYRDASALVMLNSLKSADQYREALSNNLLKPDGAHFLPSNPPEAYAKEWKGWGAFLGTGRLANHRRVFWPFDKARRYVISLRLGSFKNWKLYCKGSLPGKKQRPEFIPSNPNATYADKGWVSFSHWIGLE